MSKPFDMELFLTGVLTGSHTTRQRHVRQAKIIQTAIAERWQQETPWDWKQKHLDWFLKRRLAKHGAETRYYYLLTIRLIVRRLGASWVLVLRLDAAPLDTSRNQSKLLFTKGNDHSKKVIEDQ